MGPGNRSALAFLLTRISALLAAASLIVWAGVHFGRSTDWLIPVLLGVGSTAAIVAVTAIESRHYFADAVPSSRRRWRTAWPRMIVLAAIEFLFLGPCFFPLPTTDDLFLSALVLSVPLAIFWWLAIHPHVDIREEELVVVNPLKKTRIPLDSIESMEPGWTGLVIRSSRGVTRARVFWEGVGIASTPPWRSEEFIATASAVAARNLRRSQPGPKSTYSEDYRPFYQGPKT